MKVGEIMTQPVITITEDRPLHDSCSRKGKHSRNAVISLIQSEAGSA